MNSTFASDNSTPERIIGLLRRLSSPANGEKIDCFAHFGAGARRIGPCYAERNAAMKTMTFTLVVLFLMATGQARADELRATRLADEPADQQLPPLKVLIDKSRVDLEQHRLEVKMSRKAGSVELKVFGESGNIIADEQHDFAGAPAGAALAVTWRPSSDEAVAKIEVFAHDAFGYYSGVRIVPWALYIPHEEVNFETDSAVVRGTEEPKLAATLAKIADALEQHKDLGTITLYVAGHTDTVGSAAHNMELSQRRAQSIAAWFRRHGIRIPIASAGFGESALLVKTADEVDEPKNRRVDYVLSVEEPRFKNSNRVPAWKRL
jgi:outer membrane protein OmpA-like peptidoglycan-associated protein